MKKIINNTIFNIIALYKSNYNDFFHVRKIAKLINSSHVAILPHLKELENQNILYPKTIGRNKVFFLNLNNTLIKQLIIIAEKIYLISSINKNEFLSSLYKELHNLNGYAILINPQNINTVLNIVYIGNKSDLDSKNIKTISKKFNKKIKILSGTPEQFDSQLKKQTTFIKNVLKNHLILTNTEIFVNSMYKYYKNQSKIS